MRWSYKTVHFSLKKDGLLGSAFLDEEEIEISLNEYGHAGWELVSLMEVNDGLIAVFKQEMSQGIAPVESFEPVEKYQEPDEQLITEESRPDKGNEGLEEVDSDEDDVGSIKIF
jgi:uncharacterized protein DUF4177